ncbi:hypothetical protein B0H14DRAFT_2598822 [Mycena olivaceomarginata]|nr:hypothetical protein B0H14DRAFT_2598822 [Mycena olivaceomarginata]
MYNPPSFIWMSSDNSSRKLSGSSTRSGTHSPPSAISVGGNGSVLLLAHGDTVSVSEGVRDSTHRTSASSDSSTTFGSRPASRTKGAHVTSPSRPRPSVSTLLGEPPMSPMRSNMFTRSETFTCSVTPSDTFTCSIIPSNTFTCSVIPSNTNAYTHTDTFTPSNTYSQTGTTTTHTTSNTNTYTRTFMPTNTNTYSTASGTHTPPASLRPPAQGSPCSPLASVHTPGANPNAPGFQVPPGHVLHRSLTGRQKTDKGPWVDKELTKPSDHMPRRHLESSDNIVALWKERTPTRGASLKQGGFQKATSDEELQMRTEVLPLDDGGLFGLRVWTPSLRRRASGGSTPSAPSLRRGSAPSLRASGASSALPPSLNVAELSAYVQSNEVELQAIAEKVSLPHLAVMTGFVGNSTEARGYRVGIDARLPFIPVFVFDGPGHPSLKRGKLVKGNDHWLVQPFQQMLDGFGFMWIVVLSYAPGEAEVELSVMSTTGWVDAVLTDDSDSFVFGASVVLRIRSEDNENYEASRYSSFDISTDGLENCGITTAIALARAGLGKHLVRGLHHQSRADSLSFLETWCELSHAELLTNSSGHLPHRYRQLAAKIPSDFPDLDVINLYLHPLISDLAYTTTGLVFRPPRLDILACFAEDHFTWGDSLGILAHFANNLFVGLVIQELVQRALASDGLPSEVQPPSIIKKVVSRRSHQSTGHLAELHLVLSVDPSLITHALNAITCRHDPALGAQIAVAAWLATKLPQVRAWVPQSMVDRVYPGLVLDYIYAQGTSATRKGKTPAQNTNTVARPIIVGHTPPSTSMKARLQGKPMV